MKEVSKSKYLQPKYYILYILKLINHPMVLQKLDILFAPRISAPFKYPPIFFIGAPRSGSTLIYQVVTDAFEMAYLSNRHCQFFGAPALAERIFRPTRNKPPSSFISEHGKTKGWSAPSECGEWWYRFFRRVPAYVTLADVDEKNMHQFRRSLLAFTGTTDKPVVFKNLYASVRLEAISKYIPEALFVIIKRNELDNAQSILEGRMKTLGCYDKWWSIPPPNVKQLEKLEPAQQAIEQIRCIHTQIRTAIESGFIDSNRVISLQYETFCDDVHASLDKLEKFFIKNELSIKRRYTVPEQFSMNRKIRIENKVYSKLKELSES